MKKALKLTLILSTTLLAQFKELPVTLSTQDNEEVQQNRTITSPSNYTTLRSTGMSVGVLDEMTAPFTLNVGFRNLKLQDENDSIGNNQHSFLIPKFTFGSVEKTAFSLYYNIDALSSITKKDSLTLSLPLNRFGLNFATQTDDKKFRFGINGDAFYGKSSYKETTDSGRVVMGVKEVGLSFGSKPTDGIGFDIGVYADGYIDTLFGTAPTDGKQLTQERIAEVSPLNIKAAINYGKKGSPVQSSFGYTFRKNHFVYATAEKNGNEVTPPNNHDPIVTDSIEWHLNTRGIITPIENKLSVNPSVNFAYWHNRHKRMNPGDDNHPMNYKGEDIGYKYETKSFNWGLGLDFTILNFIDYWTEYGHSFVNLDLTGEKYQDSTDEFYSPVKSTKPTFNRFATGAEFSIHKIPNINYSKTGGLYFNLSFLSVEESNIYHSYYGAQDFKHLHDITTNNELWRYESSQNIAESIKTKDFTLGLRATFLDKTLETIGRVHFVNQEYIGFTPDYNLSGPRFQLDLVYNLKDK